MQTRNFGRLGWPVSEIGFGAWAIGGSSWGSQDDRESLKALHRALDLGVSFIDTAQGYGNGHSERLIGQVLKQRGLAIGAGPVRVATKIPPQPGNWPPFPDEKIEDRSPEKYLRQRVEFSLNTLQTNVLDLVQLHTWTRAWNRDPIALQVLQDLKAEGKLLGIGISTPEYDQNSLIDLMRAGYLDAVQVIYNIFEQEPRAELLPEALAHNVAVIVRVVFDEGALTGKFTADTSFAKNDFRNTYFKGDRLTETVRRVDALRKNLSQYGETDLASVAIRFALQHEAVSTVIPGIRNEEQAEKNCRVSDMPALSAEVMQQLLRYNWRRAFWYGG